MRKIIVSLIILFISSAYGADRIHVSALDDFNSVNPKKYFHAKVLEDSVMTGYYLSEGTILNCSIQKITNPKRAKRDAKIFFNIMSYENDLGIHIISKQLTGKYAKTVINKEEIKKVPPKKIAKKTVSIAGSFFVTGFSHGVSFVDGVVENEENNRLKSGVKKVYDDSILSYVEMGEEIDIKEGDTFYLIIKEEDAEKLQN